MKGSSSRASTPALLPQALEDVLTRDALATVELGETFLDLLVQPLSPLLVQKAQALANDLLGRIVASAGHFLANELLDVT